VTAVWNPGRLRSTAKTRGIHLLERGGVAYRRIWPACCRPHSKGGRHRLHGDLQRRIYPAGGILEYAYKHAWPESEPDIKQRFEVVYAIHLCLAAENICDGALGRSRKCRNRQPRRRGAALPPGTSRAHDCGRLASVALPCTQCQCVCEEDNGRRRYHAQRPAV